ncbi:hypothetical protein [Bdellovibrio svalbardensis]|uniref:Uncharacterized protein n=1 Tax=Bdellovibrio svalbardensis TaxID=2972972 RepID=A0ABT6DI66_9BACT|nr:hypothetical protein [Bdellovibrio svalbardensis]MDG0816204.1 hypothetical protein [Bdellovibrio svalbardensis]
MGCTDANPKVAALHALDEFEFKKNFVVTADLSSIPLQAKCSRFIDHVDVSFDSGATWTNTSTYDTSSQFDCANSNYTMTLSNSKAPWNSMSFTSGQVVNVKFRALSRVGNYVYRDISVKYTPSATIRQEVLVGAGTSTAANIVLKGRIRAQKQAVASGGSVVVKGRILE